jgi:hypothetical protein
MRFDLAKWQGKAAAICRRQIIAAWRVERPGSTGLQAFFYFYKELSMSLPIASAGAPSALSATNVHSHGHGHKKGLESATDPASDSDAPTGSTQGLFGNLLDSMEQVIGTQSPTQPVSMNKTAAQAASAQSASATSSTGDAAKALLSTIGSALKFFA